MRARLRAGEPPGTRFHPHSPCSTCTAPEVHTAVSVNAPLHPSAFSLLNPALMQAFKSTDPAEWRKEWNKGEEKFTSKVLWVC